MRLHTSCPYCDKNYEVVSSIPLAGETFEILKCGHSVVTYKPTLVPKDNSEYKAILSDKEAYDFQREGVDFVEASGFNCLIADPMGLGKTIQAAIALRRGRKLNKFNKCLILVRSSTLWQWMNEYKEWSDPRPLGIFMIQGSKAFIPGAFDTYLMSMDTLARMMANPAQAATLLAIGIDLVIVDECHSFKNPESSRSQALVAFMQRISIAERTKKININCPYCSHQWSETLTIKINLRNKVAAAQSSHSARCPECATNVRITADKQVVDDTDRQIGLIMLSGTPIKNRADEYFVPLNLLRPQIFYSHKMFRESFLEKDSSGKWSRIRPDRLAKFNELTKDFIIRRDKSILKLPPFRRTFETYFNEDESIKVQYNKALKDLQDVVDSKEKLNFMDVNDSLMALRRITGIAKVKSAVEEIEEFLETSEPDEKIAIGIHHHAVRELLYANLTARKIPTLVITGGDNPEKKYKTVEAFKRPENRVIIISELAGGTGVDGLQKSGCATILVLERQWNAADEEQFEARFWRDGVTGPAAFGILAKYAIIRGTIDEYFTTMVEYKRKICGETLDGWNFTQDGDAIKDLVDKTLRNRL